MGAEEFLANIGTEQPSSVERAVALLWWHTQQGLISGGLAIKQICDEIEGAGYGKQNGTRLRSAIKADKRTICAKDLFRINVQAMADLDKKYLPYLKNKPIKHSDILFEVEAFKDTRSYIPKVVLQINRSYEESLYDCCAVMIRRLMETLIIELYESLGRADELKVPGTSHYKMFEGLLKALETDKSIHVGRNAMNGLRNFKSLADSSAHNRRFLASKKEIDDLRQDVQFAVVELRQMAFGK